MIREWTEAALGSRGLLLQEFSRAAVGRQAEVFKATAADGTSFAVKRFTQGYKHNSVDAVRAEHDALAAFQRALARPLRCPEPLGWDADLWAYLMTWEQGVPFDAAPDRDDERLAGLLVAGLRTFHDAVGRVYGDFQPANVLVDGAEVVLLDPTLPNPRFDRPSGSLLAADVGYWLHVVASQTPRRALTRPTDARARFAFAATLLRAAAAGDDRLVDEAVAVAASHLDRLDDSAKEKAVRATARPVLWALARSVSRSVRP